MNQTNFPLPTLKKKLDSLAVDLHEGKGFCQIKGLNPTDFSLEDGVVVYLGIVSYIADRRARQDDAGNMLGRPGPTGIPDGRELIMGSSSCPQCHAGLRQLRRGTSEVFEGYCREHRAK